MVAMVTDSITVAEGQVVVLPQPTHQVIHAINGDFSGSLKEVTSTT